MRHAAQVIEGMLRTGESAELLISCFPHLVLVCIVLRNAEEGAVGAQVCCCAQCRYLFFHSPTPVDLSCFSFFFSLNSV